jgi:hypothetical protein
MRSPPSSNPTSEVGLSKTHPMDAIKIVFS